MKALNLHAVGDLRYEDVPMPVRQAGEVLLKVHACGICGSDLPRVFTKGTYHFPTIPGHEFAGEIVEAVVPQSSRCCRAANAKPARWENTHSAAITTTTARGATALSPNTSP